MPRPRARPLFELGGQWISQEPGRPGYYRYWNDAGNGRTRRASLGTEDLEEAKGKLAEIVIRGTPKSMASYLSIVLESYFCEKTDHLASRGSARNAGSLLLKCWGEATKISTLSSDRQKEFVRWSLQRNHAISTIARNLGVLAAALVHAKISMEITYSEGAILSQWPEFKPKPARSIYEPTDQELARLLAASIPNDLRRWLLNAMATAGRPAAVLELSPKSRLRELGLISLIPEGRRQNKKYRPTVQELPIQKVWLDRWESEDREFLQVPGAEPRYCSYANVDSLDTALRRWRGKDEVNVPRISVYSIRHRAVTVMRAAGVPSEQIAFQVGHRRPGDRTTRGYGEYGPGYLDKASAALSAWVVRVLQLASANSHGIPTIGEMTKAVSR